MSGFLSRRPGAKTRAEADAEKVPRIEIELAALQKRIKALEAVAEAAGTGEIAVEWVSYVPALQGFGAAVTDCFYKQSGDDLLLRLTWELGTTTGVEARLGLPTGFAVATAQKESLGALGAGASVTDIYFVTASPAATYLTFGTQIFDVLGMFFNIQGSDFPGSAGTKFSGTFRVPVTKV